MNYLRLSRMYLGQNGITVPSVFGETRIVGEHEGQKWVLSVMRRCMGWMERAGRSLSLGNSQLYRPITDGERNRRRSCKKAREGRSEKFTRPWSPIFDRPWLLHVNKKKKRGRERELRRLSNYQLNSPFTDSGRYRVSPWTSFIRADIPTMLCFFVGQILLDTAYTSVDFIIIIFIFPFFSPFSFFP